jgi:hypothetical protein
LKNSLDLSHACGSVRECSNQWLGQLDIAAVATPPLRRRADQEDCMQAGVQARLESPRTVEQANTHPFHVFAGEAKQSISPQEKDGLLRRFASLRKRFAFVAGNDDFGVSCNAPMH